MLEEKLTEVFEEIIGTPTTEVESLVLYCVSAFAVILIIKLIYDLISYLTGLNR